MTQQRAEYKTKRKRFRIESIWTMRGVDFIEAHSAEQATRIAEDGGLPAEQEYQCESFEVVDVQEVTP